MTLKVKNPYIILLSGTITITIIMIAYLMFDTGPAFPQATTMARMKNVIVALQMYRADYRCFPTGSAQESIKSLYAPPLRKKTANGWNTYMEIREPSKNIFGFWKYSPAIDKNDNYLDAWGTPFIINISENAIYIRSCGPNRRDDGGKGDDIELISVVNDSNGT